MKLFIIGNGFDKAHNLPTAYWDFRTYLDSRDPDFLASFEEHYQLYPGMSDENKRNLLWNRFEANLANIDEDVIIENGVGIDLGIESGDVGIEDTMYRYLSDEYNYIRLLPVYLKEWVRTIRIRDCLPRTSKICRDNKDFYISFNYTCTLETVYKIPADSILHIHGSLHDYTNDPVIGHGNKKRIQDINSKINEAEKIFDEKLSSVCKVVCDYYEATFKDVRRYMPSLSKLSGRRFDDIIVLGASLEGVDLPYFRFIDNLTGNNLKWEIYCYHKSEEQIKKDNLVSLGIDAHRIETHASDDFFDLQNDKAATDLQTKIRYGF